MSTVVLGVFLACAVLVALSAAVAAASLLTIALATMGARRDCRRFLGQIAGTIAAGRELARRAAGDVGVPTDASPRWADALHGPRVRR